MKIVVSGGWSYGNIGDEVILKSTIYLIEKYFPNIPVLYTSYNPDGFNTLYNYKAIRSVHSIIERINPDLDSYFNILENLDKFDLIEYANLFEEDTIFIMSGGGYFVEEWQSQFVARLLEISIAKRKNARVILIGQSIGPIITSYGRSITKEALNKSDYIAVRDINSVELLRNITDEKEIHFFPDLAVVVSDIIPKIPTQVGTIGIMPAAYSSYTAIDSGKKNKYFEKLKKRLSLGGITYKRELKKIILSTQWNWDIQFAHYLSKHANQQNISISYTSSAEDLCSKLSSIELLISTKMHPLIIASSYGIPTIGISYNFKVDNYMNLIGRSNFCYRIDKVSSNSIIRQINSIKEDYTEIAAYKHKVYEMMDDLKSRFCDE
jgi:polysaccharide pyruvyl transferase WcaK-like protein